MANRLIESPGEPYVCPVERTKAAWTRGEFEDTTEFEERVALALEFEDAMDENTPDWRSWAAQDKFDEWAKLTMEHRRLDAEIQIVNQKINLVETKLNHKEQLKDSLLYW